MNNQKENFSSNKRPLKYYFSYENPLNLINSSDE